MAQRSVNRNPHDGVELKPYAGLAAHYAKVMQHVDYAMWGRYLKSILRLHGKRPTSLLELGSGSCLLAKHFQLPSIKLRVSSDLSYPMMAAADPKIAGHRVVLNAAAIPFNKPFDLILMTYDAINYLNPKELRSLFRQIKKLLTKDGIFIFDAATKQNSLDYFDDVFDAEEYENVFLVRHSFYDEKKATQHNVFEFFERRDDGLYERFTETHRQILYAKSEFLTQIEKAGLEVLGVYADFTLNPGDDLDSRLQFVVGSGK